jgi:hypothetical protein
MAFHVFDKPTGHFGSHAAADRVCGLERLFVECGGYGR